MTPISFIGIFLAVFGLVIFLLGIAAMICTSVVQNKEYAEVTTVITGIERYIDLDGETESDVYVSFEYNGESYGDIPLDSYSSSMNVSDERKVLINPDNPTKAHLAYFNFLFGGIFEGIGLVLAIIGLVILMCRRRRKNLSKRLVEGGCFIEAEIDCIGTSNVRVNSKPTYLIRCNYRNPNDGKICSFKSELLTFDPTPMLDGEALRVYVDKDDFTKNYVDVSQIKEKYVEC